MRRLVFVYGDHTEEQIDQHDRLSNRAAVFHDLTEGGGHTLEECWQRAEVISDSEEFISGTTILPYEALENWHLLGEVLLNSSRTVIVEHPEGEFRIGILRKQGHFNTKCLGGLWSGHLLGTLAYTPASEAITANATRPIEVGDTLFRSKGSFYGREFNALRIADLDVEEMALRHHHHMEFLFKLMLEDQTLPVLWREFADADPVTLKRGRLAESLYARGLTLPAWALTDPRNDLPIVGNVCVVPDAYVLDGKWTEYVPEHYTRLRWIDHCGQVFADRDPNTLLTIYQVE